MRKWIKEKIHSIAEQYNRIHLDSKISPSAYISGSSISCNVEIGDKSKLYKATVEGNIRIGRYTSLWGPGIVVIGRVHGVSIGNFCSIARQVSIQEDYHDISLTSTYFLKRNFFDDLGSEDAYMSKGPITIGHDVWIGANAQVLSGVSVGHGAVIGAGAIVTKDVPAYAVVAGNPAKIIKYRFSDSTIKELLESTWWDWPREQMYANKDFFFKKRT